MDTAVGPVPRGAHCRHSTYPFPPRVASLPSSDDHEGFPGRVGPAAVICGGEAPTGRLVGPVRMATTPTETSGRKRADVRG